VVNTPYVGKTPTQIAQTFMPYFTGVANAKETWAEEFAVNAGVVNPASPFLQLTDKIFINNNFKCSVYDVHIYSSTGIPPTTTQISGNGCGPFTQSQLK